MALLPEDPLGSSLEIARAGARVIDPDIRIVIAEGNYLRLDEALLSGLCDCFGLTVVLDVPYPVLERRLHERRSGYPLDPIAINEKSFRWRMNEVPTAPGKLADRLHGPGAH